MGRTILACVVLFVVFFGLDFLIHGHCLAGIYQETASVWRSQEDMLAKMPYMTAGQLIFAIFFVIFYLQFIKNGTSSIKQGAKFGLLVGLLSAPMSSLAWYAVLPIPGRLAVDWFIAGMVQCLILGIIAGFIFKGRKA